MKLLVAVKRVLDYAARVRVSADKSKVDLSNAKMSMNPFCEIAVEEALRLREGGHASEVVAVTVGGKSSEAVLRSALALGVNRVIHVHTEAEVAPLSVARLLQAVTERETPGMVLLGKQAIDDDCNQTGQMLAAMLKWPQGTFASAVSLSEDRTHADVTREVDSGLEKLKLRLPAVITTDLRLNTPRYIAFKNLIASKKKPIEKVTPEELGVVLDEQLKIIRVEEPAGRKAGVMLNSVAELVDKLRNEAKVL